MKLRSLIFSTILAGGMFANANAADTATVAFVNAEQILHDSTAAKSAEAQLEEKQKAFQAELGPKEEALHKEEEALSKQKSVISADALNKKIKELQTKEIAVQKDVEKKKKILAKASSAGFKSLQKALIDSTNTVAKEKGYTVVVQMSALLYADPKLDITQDVLTKLNSSLPQVTLDFKAAAESTD